MNKYLYYVLAIAIIAGAVSIYLINESETTIAFLKVIGYGFIK